MENMEIWEKVKQPPKSALREIGAGRLKGKTDISPQWRYQVMTEIFGPCGVGWKYTVDNKWREEGSSGQVMAFADVSLYVKTDGEWSEAIPGSGGSMLVVQEKSGLHTSDEAYKMAVTDALSVAMKMLGIAADIYMGLWDGSKYKTAPPEQPKKPKAEKAQSFAESIKPLQDQCSKEDFLALLGVHGYTKIEEITNREHQVAIFRALKDHLGVA